jgi:MFS family permease
MLFGAIIPLNSIILGEVVGREHRGRYQAVMQGVNICGKIYLILTMYIFLDGLSGGNWRGLILFNSILVIPGFLLTWIQLDETARFLLSEAYYSESFAIIHKMGKLNCGPEYELTAK